LQNYVCPQQGIASFNEEVWGNFTGSASARRQTGGRKGKLKNNVRRKGVLIFHFSVQVSTRSVRQTPLAQFFSHPRPRFSVSL
jgi:hypothetical protein